MTGGGIYVEKEILGTLDIYSKLGFLISRVVNSLWPFLGLIKDIWWLPKGCFFEEEDYDPISWRNYHM